MGLVLWNEGKPLFFMHSHFFTARAAFPCMLMMSWFTQISHLWTVFGPRSSAANPADEESNVASGLLQSAHALAGLDPHEAERLRGAARAYLSVIR